MRRTDVFAGLRLAASLMQATQSSVGLMLRTLAAENAALLRHVLRSPTTYLPKAAR